MFCIYFVLNRLNTINKKIMERFTITFTETANDRDDHVTTFILHLPLAVLSFSVKLSSFALASKIRIILSYCHRVLIFSRKH